MTDTLTTVANNGTAQAVAVIFQGLMLIVGAILNLCNRKGCR